MVRWVLVVLGLILSGCLGAPETPRVEQSGATLLGNPACSAATCRCTAARFKTGDCDLILTTNQTLPVVGAPHSSATFGNSGPFTWPIPSGTIPNIYEHGESSLGGRTFRIYMAEIWNLWRHVHGAPRTLPVADRRGSLFIRYPLKDSTLYVEVHVIGDVAENLRATPRAYRL
jgi:hypothetical protein